MARGNIVSITGNLTSDPKEHTFESGTRKATFGLAYNEDRKDADGNWTTVGHFFEVEVWQGTVTVAKKFSKGNLCSIYGRLAWRKWETDGVQHEKVYIIADSIYGEKMYAPAEGGGEGGAQQPAQGRQRQRSEPAAEPARQRQRGATAPAAAAEPPAKINEPTEGDDDQPPW